MDLFEVREFGKRNRKVVFVLTGWHMPLWTTYLPALFFYVKGYRTVCYAYDNDIFSPDTQKTIKGIEAIKADILERIAALKMEGYEGFAAYAMSFGTILALLVANESNDVTKLILNTTGGDPALTAWSWDNVFLGFKEKLIEQGFTLEKLQKTWKSITPLHRMEGMTGKHLLIYLSEKDQIIPYASGKRLAEGLEGAGSSCKLVISRKLNHLHACIYNMLRPHIYMQFLKDSEQA